MGRRNRSGALWAGYVLAFLGSFLVGASLIPAYLRPQIGGDGAARFASFDAFFRAHPTHLGFYAGFLLLAFVLFAAYVLGQQRLLAQARKHLGLPIAGSPWTFVALVGFVNLIYFLDRLRSVSTFLLFLMIPLLMLAYASLQHDYNGVWAEFGRRTEMKARLDEPEHEAALEHQPS